LVDTNPKPLRVQGKKYKPKNRKGYSRVVRRLLASNLRIFAKIKMKKAIIGIVIVLLLVGLGMGGYGLMNARADKAYAENAKTLVSDFEKKYSDDYLDKQLDLDTSGTTEADLKQAKTTIEQVKKDAEDSLSRLNSKKSSSRVSTLKQESQDYFNLTIKACDNSLTYLDYSVTLVEVGNSLEATGGNVNSMVDAIAQFESAQNSIGDSIDKLEKITPPAGMENFHKDLIAALKDLDEVLGKMNSALKAGDLTALETYSNELMTSITKLTAIDTPDSDEISNNILSTDETKKLDELPAKISSEADSIAKKKMVF